MRETADARRQRAPSGATPWLRAPLSAAFAAGLVLAACSSSDSDAEGSAGNAPVGGTGANAGAGGTGRGGSGGSAGTGGAVSTAGSAGSSGRSARGGNAGVAGAGSHAGGSSGDVTAGTNAGGRAGSTSGGAGGREMAGASGGGSAGAAGASAGAGNVATSCAMSGPGLTTCGKDEDEDCCTSLPVEGGAFSRTYQNDGNGPTGERDPATVSTFLLDKYEVTVGRFRQYVNYLVDGGSPPAAGSGKHGHLNAGDGLADTGAADAFEPGWNASWNSKIPTGAGAAAEWKTLLTSQGSSTGGSGCHIYGSWTEQPGDNELLPITCTSWYESYAFCIWDGGFLPTEAEWKYAAAGGDEQRMYPWGTTAPGSGNEYAIYDCCYPSGQCSASSGRDTCTGLVNAAPVGFAASGLGRYGQLDLSGSVWEWLLDRHASSYPNPCEDCAYLSGNTSNRVLPGGGFHTGLNPYLLSSNRQSVSYDAETYRGDYAVGVRCARSP